MRFAALASVVVLAACTGGPSGGSDPNPSQLWFAQNAARTAMVLTDVEPHPF